MFVSLSLCRGLIASAPSSETSSCCFDGAVLKATACVCRRPPPPREKEKWPNRIIRDPRHPLTQAVKLSAVQQMLRLQQTPPPPPPLPLHRSSLCHETVGAAPRDGLAAAGEKQPSVALGSGAVSVERGRDRAEQLELCKESTSCDRNSSENGANGVSVAAEEPRWRLS